MRTLTAGALALACGVTVASGCSSAPPDETADRDETGDDTAESEVAVAAAALTWVAVDGAALDAAIAVGAGVVCAATCAQMAVAVTIVAIAGGVAYFVYANRQDAKRLPPARIQKFNMGLDWLEAAETSPVLSSNAVKYLSAKYSVCVLNEGGEACKWIVYSQALAVSACEANNGGPSCATDGYLARAEAHAKEEKKRCTKSQPVPDSACFGAVGSKCDGVFPLAPCRCNKDGSMTCMVSIGSQMHDQCCAEHPRGYFCNGLGDLDKSCKDPRGQDKNYYCCKVEWQHARNDYIARRQWPQKFWPLQPAARGTTLARTVVERGMVTAQPGPNAFLAPSGTHIWSVDAGLGWCSGSKFQREMNGPGLDWNALCQ